MNGTPLQHVVKGVTSLKRVAIIGTQPKLC